MKPFNIFILSAALILFISCSPEISVNANNDGSTSTSITGGFSTSTADLLKSLACSMDGSNNSSSSKDSPLFSSVDITNALLSAGLKNVYASVPDAEHFSASGVIPNNESQSSTESSGVASFLRTGLISRTKNSVSISVGPAELMNIYNSVDEESHGYLDLLMAPVFMGEKMSVSEYHDLLASVYGPSFADELVSGVVTINLSAPTSAKSASKKVSEKIPLGELLTLSDRKTWSISW